VSATQQTQRIHQNNLHLLYPAMLTGPEISKIS